MSSAERQPSPGLHRLLERKLDTYEKLEVVVLLFRGTEARVQDLARELQIGEEVLRRVVADLSRAGLVDVEGDRLRLTASPDELPFVKEGAELYASDRGNVFSLLSAIGMDRIRSLAKKDEGDG